MPMVSLGIPHYLHTLIPNLVLILFENPESRPWTKANPASRAPNKENPAFRTRKNHLGSPRRNRKRWVLWVMWNWVYIYSTGILAKGSNEQTWSRRALDKDRDFKQRLRKVLVRWPEVIFFRHPSTPQVSDGYSGENVAERCIPVLLFFIAIIPTRLLWQMLANPSWG